MGEARPKTPDNVGRKLVFSLSNCVSSNFHIYPAGCTVDFCLSEDYNVLMLTSCTLVDL